MFKRTVHRATFLAYLAVSERNHRRAADSLAVLRGLLSRLAALSGDARESVADGDALAAALASFPRLSLIAWKRLCADDPLLAYLLKARAEYRRADEHRGKGNTRIEQRMWETYRKAMERGFTGSLGQWQELLKFRAT